MNDIVKIAFGFVLGAVTGAIVTYIYQDKRLSKKFEEDLKDLENMYEKYEDDNSSDTAPDHHDDGVDISGEDYVPPIEAQQAYAQMQEDMQKLKTEPHVNRAQYSSLTRTPSPEERRNINNKEGETNMNRRPSRPYYIDIKEFKEMDGKDGYKALDLFYYEDSDSFCDDTGSAFEEAHIALGWDILSDIQEHKVDDEVYVRNDNLKEVYCVFRDNISR